MIKFLRTLFSNQNIPVSPPQTHTHPAFLTTQALNFYIEEVIKNAQEYIYILSPYIKLCSRIEELILERKKAGVKIIIICRSENLQKNIEYIASEIKDRKNLHAKAFLNENAAIVGSLNLYDFSQINNDEMGFIYTKNDTPTIYNDIKNDIERIYKASILIYTEPKAPPLIHTESKISIKNKNIVSFKIGKKYTLEELDAQFDFEYKKPSGIKSIQNGNILLFMNDYSNYNNKESQNTIYFEGQNTGKGAQQLIFGNKQLYDTYNSPEAHIFLFKSMHYAGEYYICKKPFIKNGKWIFPITLKKT